MKHFQVIEYRVHIQLWLLEKCESDYVELLELAVADQHLVLNTFDSGIRIVAKYGHRRLPALLHDSACPCCT